VRQVVLCRMGAFNRNMKCEARSRLDAVRPSNIVLGCGIVLPVSKQCRLD
jgi:hypothetical protein